MPPIRRSRKSVRLALNAIRKIKLVLSNPRNAYQPAYLQQNGPTSSIECQDFNQVDGEVWPDAPQGTLCLSNAKQSLIQGDTATASTSQITHFPELPNELLHLIMDSLDLQSLSRLQSTCRALSEISTAVLHNICGLRQCYSLLSLSTLEREPSPPQPLLAFKAFRSFHRRITVKSISVVIGSAESASTEEAAEHLLFGLSRIPAYSLNHISVALCTPLTNINAFLQALVAEAHRQVVYTLHISYPYAIEQTPFPALRSTPRPSHLSLTGDPNQMCIIIGSLADSLQELTFRPARPFISGFMSPKPLDDTPSATDFGCIVGLRLPRLQRLYVTAEFMPHELAVFVHQHQDTLRELEIFCIDTPTEHSAGPSMPASHVYSHSLEKLTGPADYLEVFLGLFSRAPLERLVCTAPEIATESGCSGFLNNIDRCLSYCKGVLALELCFPAYLPEMWNIQPFLNADDAAIAPPTDTKTHTLRLRLKREGPPSNDVVVTAFRYWFNRLPNILDVQYREARPGGPDRKELLQALDDGPVLRKISIRSGRTSAENDCPIHAFDWIWTC